MSFYPCSQRREVAAALRERSELSTPELRAHVEACQQCKELVMIAQSLQKARQEAMSMARLTPPGLLWWKAQLRRRSVMTRRITKPLGIAEKLAFAIMLLLTSELAIDQGKTVDWTNWLADLPDYSAFQLDAFGSAVYGIPFGALVAAVAMICVLGGMVGYLAHSK